MSNSASGGGADAPPPDDELPPPDDDVPPPDDGPELCRLCGRDVSDPEGRARLVDPAFCEMGGVREQWRAGRLVQAGAPRCPFKPP